MNLTRYEPQIEWRAEGARPYMTSHQHGRWIEADDVAAALAAAREEGIKEGRRLERGDLTICHDEQKYYSNTPPAKGEKGGEG